MVLGERTLVVGVLNVTPDSFSDGGENLAVDRAVDRALQMAAEGADIIEIGGESTRPTSERVPLDEELARLLPVLDALEGKLTAPLSVDTYKAEVARQAVARGAQFINDVSALRFDETIAEVAAATGAGLILMHMRGEPATMQQLPPSDDIFAEIHVDMKTALATALSHGVAWQQMIFDPGIGFGKTLEQNLAILNHLERFDNLDLPIMIGTSRKSFIGALTNQPAHERLSGSLASVTAAVLRGAHLVRVHDVKPACDAVRVADAISTS